MTQGQNKATLVRGLLLVAGLTASALALAGTPSISVPSTPDTDGKVHIRGTDLAAYTNVTVRFQHDRMAPIDLVAQVGANGSFAVRFAPPVDGGYVVTVFDASGQQVGHGRFGHFR